MQDAYKKLEDIVKIKKIIRTIIIFIVAMILICVLFSVLLSVITGNFEEIFNRTLSYLLYIIGYGSLIHENLILQDLFGVFGIVTISILSAYLTVNLFWRVDDVFISSHIAIWKNANEKYYASVLAGNKGKNLCKLELSFVAYDGNKNYMGELGKTFEYPLLIKNGIWKIDMPINNGFLYDVLRTIRKGRKDCMIYATFEYVDSETGQSSIKVQEYNSDHIFVSNIKDGFYHSSDCEKKLRWRQFKHIEKNVEKDLYFNEWILRNIISFDLNHAKTINKDNIQLTINENDANKSFSLQADVDFCISNNPPDFVMALLEFTNPYQDWSSYYSKGSCFQFEISGDEGIPDIQLEIKDKSGAKLIDEKIIVTDAITKHSFRLNNNKNFNPECFSEIKEICFTVFNKPNVNIKGNFKIYNCEILIEEEPTPKYISRGYSNVKN